MKYDLIIIGAGPAGVSAALYATSRGLKTAIIEKSEYPSGTLRKVSNITHFTGLQTGESGTEFSNILYDQLIKCKVHLIYDNVTNFSLEDDNKVITCENNIYSGKAIIIASGTEQNIPEFKISDNLKKNHLHNDAKKFGGNYKNIIVIGGSDGACKEALYLSKVSKHVDLIVKDEKLGCVKEFATPIKSSKNIDVHLGSSITSVIGKDFVEKIELNNGKIINSPNAGIFYYIGSKPNTEKLNKLKLDNGYIVVDEKMKTNASGVYAAGDIRVKDVRQISTAVSDGAIAAIDAYNYINNNK